MPDIQTTVGGLRAIELYFRPMRDIATGRTVCYFSRTQLNTPDLGTLMPETFRPAAENARQSHKLFSLEILQLAESIRALNEADRIFDWVSLEMPLSILKDRATTTLLDKVCEQFSLSPGEFCFVIPEGTLTETDGTAAHNTVRLRQRGYHVLLAGFGESGCPFIRLSELSVDYVLLTPSLLQYIGKNERSDQAVHSIISFVNDLQCEPVADGVQNSSQAEALYKFGCNFCAGSLSGDYLPLSDLTQ